MVAHADRSEESDTLMRRLRRQIDEKPTPKPRSAVSAPTFPARTYKGFTEIQPAGDLEPLIDQAGIEPVLLGSAIS
jgi:hypothetical protein